MHHKKPGLVLIRSPSVHRLRFRRHNQPAPLQLDSPSFTGSSTQIASPMAEAAIFGAVVVVMIKMEGLAWQHRQPAAAARLAVSLSQQSLTQPLMLRPVPGSSGVHPTATTPRHHTPPLTPTHPTWVPRYPSSETETDAAAASYATDQAPSQPETPEANTQGSICAGRRPYARLRTFPRTMRNVVAPHG
jgi:hypothetical protein